MSLKQEFVVLASQPGSNVSALCARFGISRTTGYKWLRRFEAQGAHGLANRSRRPHRSPRQTDPALESQILALRDAHPQWGGRKLKRRLEDLGTVSVPPASTITEVLRRHGRLLRDGQAPAANFTRFEHAAPNQLWQMDFKGWIQAGTGRCYPLTVIDDHSRYAVGLHACPNERYITVMPCLQAIFERYGLPERITADNGQPWGCSQGSDVLTQLGVWLIDLGVSLTHSRPYHPQTQGKVERFNQTCDRELLQGQYYASHPLWQPSFDDWRYRYNHDRPHEALDLATPSTRYQISPRPFSSDIKPFDYNPDDQMRKVSRGGAIRFASQWVQISGALRHRSVAIRPDQNQDGVFTVHYRQQQLLTFNLHEQA